VQDLSESISPVLEEIAKNVAIREMVIADDEACDSETSDAESTIRTFVANKLKNNPDIGYDVRISKSDEVCGLDKYPLGVEGNVYAGSRIISSTLSTMGGGPKKINLFLWVKE
jgi:hypothetical protein